MLAVAAQMKSAGYRSFINYLDTMKALHVEEFEWTPVMVLCRKRCLASTQRGIGPSRQSMELPLQGIRDVEAMSHWSSVVPAALCSGPSCAAFMYSAGRSLLAPWPVRSTLIELIPQNASRSQFQKLIHRRSGASAHGDVSVPPP